MCLWYGIGSGKTRIYYHVGLEAPVSAGLGLRDMVGKGLWRQSASQTWERGRICIWHKHWLGDSNQPLQYGQQGQAHIFGGNKNLVKFWQQYSTLCTNNNALNVLFLLAMSMVYTCPDKKIVFFCFFLVLDPSPSTTNIHRNQYDTATLLLYLYTHPYYILLNE